MGRGCQTVGLQVAGDWLVSEGHSMLLDDLATRV